MKVTINLKYKPGPVEREVNGFYIESAFLVLVDKDGVREWIPLADVASINEVKQ